MSDGAHLADVLVDGLRRTSAAPALRYKQYGLWHPVSGDAAATRAERISHGLRALGVQPGEIVGLYGGNCLEWVLADLGILLAGGVSYGLDGFADAEELARGLREAGARFLFVDGEARMRAATAARASCPALQDIMLLRCDRSAPVDSAASKSLGDLEEMPSSPFVLERKLDAPAIVVPTAGTTGPSRAVVLPHRSVIAQIDRNVTTMQLKKGDERLSLLPIHHVAERVTGIYAALASGVTVNFPESPDTALADLAELQPSIVQLAPRMWRAMRSGIALTLAETTPFQRRIVASALRSPNAFKDRLALKPLRRRLGIDGARLCLTTGGPTHPDDAAWFAALGRELHDVYALAETAGAVAITPLRDPAAPVGLQPFIDLVTETGGEIHVRGKDLSWSILGGAQSPIKWYGTGDRGAGDRVVGRMTETITHGGHALHPFEREQALLASPYISDAFVTSDGAAGLRAVILLDADQTARFAQNASVPFTHFRSLTEAAEIRALIEGVVAEVNQRFPEPAITSFHLLDRVLGPGDAELGPTMVLRRYRIDATKPAQTGNTEPTDLEGRTA